MKTERTPNLSTWQRWCEISTYHGVADGIRSRTYFGKLFWLSLVIILFVFSMANVALIFYRYVGGTKWSNRIYYQDTTSMPWPDLTICNANRANKTKLMEIGLEEEAVPYLFESIPYFYTFRLEQDTKASVQSKIAYDNFTQNSKPNINSSVRSLFRDISHQCHETIMSCPEGHGVECCGNAIPVIRQFGTCWKIKPLKPKVAKNTGLGKYPLRYIFNVHSEEYISSIFNNLLDEGLTIFTSFGNEFYVSQGSFVTLHPGTHTYVELSALKNTLNLGNDFLYMIFVPPCRTADKFNFTFLETDEYSESGCLVECHLTVVYNQCNCLLLHDVDTKVKIVAPECGPDLMSACGAEATYNLQGESAERFHECLNECKRSCSSISVDVTQRDLDFPSYATQQPIIDMLNRLSKINGTFVPQINLDSLRKNIIMVDIYYNAFGWKVSESYQTITIDSLMGIIGGSLGLYLGGSIITIIQLMVYLFGSCRKKRLIKHN